MPAPSDVRAERALVWFRRDLRIADHAALWHALRAARRVHCVFVFDTEILDPLPRADRRVEFIRHCVAELSRALRGAGGALEVLHGRARDLIPAHARALDVGVVHANHDYEPQAIARDAAVERALGAAGIAFRSFKDQVVFERDEVLTGAGTPFSVFTPYRNAWLKKIAERPDGFWLRAYPVEKYLAALAPPRRGAPPPPSLEQLGFEKTDPSGPKPPAGIPGAEALLADFLTRIDRYRDTRDFPAVKGPSYLSVHLRFGTLSIRRCAREALARGSEGARTWLSELIWRDFYFQILAHHPRVVERSFRPEYDALRFENDPEKLAAWREARTGYPIVDAAMRQINQTGWMHNRLRMIAASFLVKDLHVDWREGERYFAERLIDFDLSANNGGWQWAASTGCDAQPYFRIFNPVTQSERFDPQGRFIRRYLPELARVPDRWIHAPWTMPPLEQRAAGCVIGRDYPAPVVDHDSARKRALELYGRVKKSAS